jgi:hypothetical protein
MRITSVEAALVREGAPLNNDSQIHDRGSAEGASSLPPALCLSEAERRVTGALVDLVNAHRLHGGGGV